MTVEVVWVDVETDGFTPLTGCKLLELSAVATGADFEPVAELEAQFAFRNDEVEAMREGAHKTVQAMHDATGLWSRLTDEENLSYEAFDEVFLTWLKTLTPTPNKLILGGNSVMLDREFIREYLPKSYQHFSYQSLDMTSVELFFQLSGLHKPYEKKKTHAAREDIFESIEQAVYHRGLSKPPF